MADAAMNGRGEETQAEEEEAEGNLQKEREGRSDLEDLPLGQGRIAVLTSAQSLSRCSILQRQVLAEPLFHEDSEGRGGETEEEASEPEDVYADRPKRGLEGGKWRGCVR